MNHPLTPALELLDVSRIHGRGDAAVHALRGLHLTVLGVLAGVSLGQVDGLPGVAVPWGATAATLVAVVLLAPVAGWLVTPSRLHLARRTR